MRHGWLVVAALTTWGCATHVTKAVPQPPGRSPFVDARATEIWSRADGPITTAEAASLMDTTREDPDRAVRLAAVWALGHGSFDGTRPDPNDEAPVLEHGTKPYYPQEAFHRGIEGTVLVEFLIDDRGGVAYAEVRESIPALDAAALATIRQWRFRPARLKGQPVPCLAQAPVTFRKF
jgi:TonB family protein